MLVRIAASGAIGAGLVLFQSAPAAWAGAGGGVFSERFIEGIVSTSAYSMDGVLVVGSGVYSGPFTIVQPWEWGSVGTIQGSSNGHTISGNCLVTRPQPTGGPRTVVEADTLSCAAQIDSGQWQGMTILLSGVENPPNLTCQPTGHSVCEFDYTGSFTAY